MSLALIIIPQSSIFRGRKRQAERLFAGTGGGEEIIHRISKLEEKARAFEHCHPSETGTLECWQDRSLADH